MIDYSIVNKAIGLWKKDRRTIIRTYGVDKVKDFFQRVHNKLVKKK